MTNCLMNGSLKQDGQNCTGWPEAAIKAGLKRVRDGQASADFVSLTFRRTRNDNIGGTTHQQTPQKSDATTSPAPTQVEQSPLPGTSTCKQTVVYAQQFRFLCSVIRHANNAIVLMS